MNGQPRTEYATFISYAREDESFARYLEEQIEARGLSTGQKAVRAFRDTSDLAGNEYHTSLDEHLRKSASMIVVCSPAARQSTYVSDEISRFVKMHGAGRLFPVLRSGLPDNEADDKRAFPPALLAAIAGMPLAADFRGFDTRKGRRAGSAAESEWYRLVANVEQTTPDSVRQADKEQEVKSLRRRLMRGAAVVVTLAVALAVVGYFWWRARTAEAASERMSMQAETEASEFSRQLQAKEQEIAELRKRLSAPAAMPRPRAAAAAETPAPVPLPSQPAPASASPPARVYFHIRDESQRSQAAALEAAVEQLRDTVVPPFERLRIGPRTSELRYFRRGDEAEARAIADAINRVGPSVEVKYVEGHETSDRIRPRHFELWLAPSKAAS